MSQIKFYFETRKKVQETVIFFKKKINNKVKH
jgi:hypothetical protein